MSKRTQLRWCQECRGHRPPGHEHPPSLFDTPTEPAYPHYDGTPPHEAAPTSLEAAVSVKGNVNRLQRLALAAIKAAPAGLTDEQGIQVTGMAANTWRPRRRELELDGLIHHAGERLTKSKRRAKVWVATDRRA